MAEFSSVIQLQDNEHNRIRYLRTGASHRTAWLVTLHILFWVDYHITDVFHNLFRRIATIAMRVHSL